MTNNPEYITAVIGGAPYSGWSSVQVVAAINQAARTFSLLTTEISFGAIASSYEFPPGTEVAIYANGDLVVQGFTNEYEPSGDARSHQIRINGRGKGQDAIDSSAEHKTGEWKDKTPAQIAKDLDKWGLGFDAKVTLQPLEVFRIYQGETVFRAIERSLRGQGVTMMGMPDGKIELTNGSVAKRHSGGLIHGHNILKYSGKISDQDRNSKTTVKGQRRKGTGPTNLRIAETHDDSGVGRYRPRIIIHEGDTTAKIAKERAKHESERAQGLSVSATIDVQGWRDDGGKLWTPNMLVYVDSAPLKIHGDMLIENVTFDQNQSGSQTKLKLVHPKAYKGKGGKSKSAKHWGR